MSQVQQLNFTAQKVIDCFFNFVTIYCCRFSPLIEFRDAADPNKVILRHSVTHHQPGCLSTVCNHTCCMKIPHQIHAWCGGWIVACAHLSPWRAETSKHSQAMYWTCAVFRTETSNSWWLSLMVSWTPLTQKHPRLCGEFHESYQGWRNTCKPTVWHHWGVVSLCVIWTITVSRCSGHQTGNT